MENKYRIANIPRPSGCQVVSILNRRIWLRVEVVVVVVVVFDCTEPREKKINTDQSSLGNCSSGRVENVDLFFRSFSTWTTTCDRLFRRTNNPSRRRSLAWILADARAHTHRRRRRGNQTILSMKNHCRRGGHSGAFNFLLEKDNWNFCLPYRRVLTQITDTRAQHRVNIHGESASATSCDRNLPTDTATANRLTRL